MRSLVRRDHRMFENENSGNFYGMLITLLVLISNFCFFFFFQRKNMFAVLHAIGFPFYPIIQFHKDYKSESIAFDISKTSF